MPVIGGQSNIKPSKLDPGTYQFTLLEVNVRQMPRGRFADPEKGQTPEDLVDKLSWVFLEEVSGDKLEVLTSLSTAENSTFYSSIGPALNDGVPPCSPGEAFDTDSLVGNACLGAVTINAKGYSKLTSLMPLPKTPKAKDKEKLPF